MPLKMCCFSLDFQQMSQMTQLAGQENSKSVETDGFAAIFDKIDIKTLRKEIAVDVSVHHPKLMIYK